MERGAFASFSIISGGGRMLFHVELEIDIIVSENVLPLFFELFSRGVFLIAQAGESLNDFTVNRLGIPKGYMENRVQTVFFNGKPVDKTETAIISDGDRIALSAAMPGLVGAVMRKGGFYSSLRDKISHKESVCAAGNGDALVSLKLFNVISRELGPLLLKNGVMMKGVCLTDIMEKHGDVLKVENHEVKLNGKTMTWIDFGNVLKPNLGLLLKVTNR